MTFRQAREPGGHVRKDSTGSLVVYADRVTRTERDEVTGDDGGHAVIAEPRLLRIAR